MTNTNLLRDVRQKHQALFSTDNDCLTIFSPGRINLIGEHTDYNEGFVMPGAIDKGIYLTISRAKGKSTIVALDMNDRLEANLAEPLQPQEGGGWKNYILGVAHLLKSAGHPIAEVNIVFGGDIPIGAGLSSSAALENAVGYALNEHFGMGIPKPELAKYSQQAEQQFAGVQCGIMDQYASMMGVAKAAILLDCRSLDFREIPMVLDDYALLLCNSNVAHNLASSEYNVRRAQCEAGVALLRKHFPGVVTLRDVSLEMLVDHKAEFDPVVYDRCSYVLEENQRVAAFAEWLTQKNYQKAGEVLFEAHRGMRDQYEITCPEIDFMVDFAASHEAVIGARMMGGGFGGCTINLVHRDGQQRFAEDLAATYQRQFGKAMTPIAVEIGQGTSKV